jgi:hypothetical protein
MTKEDVCVFFEFRIGTIQNRLKQLDKSTRIFKKIINL